MARRAAVHASGSSSARRAVGCDDEQGRGLVVEALGDLLTDPRPRAATARAQLVRLGEVVFDAVAGKLARQAPAAVRRVAGPGFTSGAGGSGAGVSGNALSLGLVSKSDGVFVAELPLLFTAARSRSAPASDARSPLAQSGHAPAGAVRGFS